MDNAHLGRSTLRAIGLVALAMLVAFVAALALWGGPGSATAVKSSATGAPASSQMELVQEAQQEEAPERAPNGRDCPKDRDGQGGGGQGDGSSQGSGYAAPGSTAAPEV